MGFFFPSGLHFLLSPKISLGVRYGAPHYKEGAPEEEKMVHLYGIMCHI